MSAPELATRVRARVLDVHDGDTYGLLLDVLGTGFRIGAVTAQVRLRDYSCPELRQPGGREARAAAASLLLEAKEVVCELRGQMTFARHVGWLWADGVAVGPALEKQGHARAGAFMG